MSMLDAGLPPQTCDGPDCAEDAPGLPMPPDNWYALSHFIRREGQPSRGQHRAFCSLTCLQRWVERELSQEGK